MSEPDTELVTLLGRLFHDLRSPVNAIIGFSNLVRNEAAGPTTAKQREFLDDVLRSANELLAIINNNDRRVRALATAFGDTPDKPTRDVG